MIFSGKTIAITGAGSGVGRALAAGFAADGARVVAIGRTAATLEETAELCAGRMRWVVGDVRREEDVDQLFRLARDHGDSVDALINNAALYPKDLFLDQSHATWAEAIEVNVVGIALCCRRALPGMLERGHGRIVNVGSFAWKGPMPTSSAYAASKAAVTVFTRALAGEIDRERYPDVLVNELLPGVFRTRMSEVGDDPATAYPHARAVVALPAGGPHGEIFLRDQIFREDHGLRARVRRVATRLLRGGRA